MNDVLYPGAWQEVWEVGKLEIGSWKYAVHEGGEGGCLVTGDWCLMEQVAKQRTVRKGLGSGS